jgi:malonyl-CoA/methylmalonyl-CoA synthetase
LCRYLFDGEATAKAHDLDGFFKTSDIARRERRYYFILGRASLDIIKTGGYKISALDVERECLALPYVEEVMVVGVDDEEFGQRVAALISIRGDQDAYSAHGESGIRTLTIEDLRMDLRDRLAGYKMPTLLRIMEGELPKTATGNVLKRVLGPKYFPPAWREEPDGTQGRRPNFRLSLVYERVHIVQRCLKNLSLYLGRKPDW